MCIVGETAWSIRRIKKGEREKETEGEGKRVRINCTVRPNCPGRINTGAHEARVESPWRIPVR